MAKIEVKQTRSSIGCKKDQIATLKALGLKRINDIVVHDDNPQISGMIQKVIHLVEVREI